MKNMQREGFPYGSIQRSRNSVTSGSSVGHYILF